jgi:hypothetical protein
VRPAPWKRYSSSAALASLWGGPPDGPGDPSEQSYNTERPQPLTRKAFWPSLVTSIELSGQLHSSAAAARMPPAVDVVLHAPTARSSTSNVHRVIGTMTSLDRGGCQLERPVAHPRCRYGARGRRCWRVGSQRGLMDPLAGRRRAAALVLPRSPPGQPSRSGARAPLPARATAARPSSERRRTAEPMPAERSPPAPVQCGARTPNASTRSRQQLARAPSRRRQLTLEP